MPTAYEVFIEAHSKKAEDNGVLQFTNKKAKDIHESFMSIKAQHEKDGKEVDEKALFYDVVGSHNKGKVFDLGSATRMFYEVGQQNKSSSSTATSYTPGIYTQIHMEQQERRKLEEQVKKMAEDNSKFKEEARLDREAFKKGQEEMMEKLSQFQSIYENCNPQQGNLRDPRDPSGSEGNGGGVGFQA